MKSNVIPVKFGHPHCAPIKANKPVRKAKKITPLGVLALSLAVIVGIIIGTIISQGMVG